LKKKTSKNIKKRVGKAIDAGVGKFETGVKKLDAGFERTGKKGKVVAVAGLATAGVIGAAALVARSGRGNTFRVSPGDDGGWVLTKDGSKKPLAVYPRKRAALSAAREHARGASPSTLYIHNIDGTLAKTHSYEASAKA
jgi:hypothetical protein